MIRMTRTQQPQGNARIDWGNPITRGLISAIDGKSNRDILAAAPSANSTTPAVGGSGIGVSYVAGQYETFPFNRASITNKVTYFSLTDYAPVSSPNGFLFGDVQDSGVGYNAGLYSNSAVFNGFVFTSGGVAASGTTSSGTAIKRLRHAMTYDGATIKVYVQGKNEASAAQSGNVATGAYGLNINRWNSSSVNGGVFYLGLVWNRALSDAEIASISANPWQIFAPDNRPLFTPINANVTLPTLGRPVTDLSPGAWAATGGTGTLASAINEVTPSAAEFVSVSSASPYTGVLDETFYPGGTNQTLSYRADSTSASSVTVRLFQGSTTIMTRTHALTSTDTLYSDTLTAPEIALIVAGPISFTLTSS